jgi:hypothetical protein
MATQNKTTETNADVKAFLAKAIVEDDKKSDALELIQWMQKWSGFPAKMWGTSIIGFGSYHYVYDSGREGDAPLIAFSPRKAEFSLYVYTQTETNDQLLNDLGKYKMGKACIYVKRLSDIEPKILEKICKETIRHYKKIYK